MIQYAFLIPLVPLAASVVMLFFGKEGRHSKMPYLGIAAMAWCFLQSALMFVKALSGGFLDELPYTRTIEWLEFGDFVIDAGVLIDGPAIALLFVVTLVSLLVQIYSLGYMHDDPRLKRYFSFLSFFTASMLGLIVTSNLLILFACWELVGVASYLLIGFWFEKPGPAYASKKAFMTTKLGDMGFYIGLLLLFSVTETFELGMLRIQAESTLSADVATWVAVLFLIGAIGKSAQVPLFIWLPDAMEGPTPVSALIHAATMVVAGIYLIARVYFIFDAAAPWVLDTVAWVGVVTAFMAATMALTAYDIKRVLAFSTISQLGYMMLALGVGGYTAALFHLTTHAFFKALLFLGAGSVIHAVKTNDMTEMGGLSKPLVWTCLFMYCATVAIAGVPLTSGWFSKEMILHEVYLHNGWMFSLAMLTAGMTAFYMFRLMFLTFHGRDKSDHLGNKVHESPSVMLVPLSILAVLSLFSGAILEKAWHFGELVQYGETHGAAREAPGWIFWLAFAMMAAGIYTAYHLYGSEDDQTAADLRKTFAPVVSLLEARYYFDVIALWFVDLADSLAQVCHWVDDHVIDALFIDSWAVFTRLSAEISGFLDDFIVDGTVDGLGSVTMDAGWAVRRLVSGKVQEYLLYISLAVMSFTIFIATR